MRDSDFAVAVALYAMGATVAIWAAYPHADVRTSCADVVRTSVHRATHKGPKQEFANYFGVSLRPPDAPRPSRP
ncbi:hypothetical protein ACUXK4_004498 [Methylorubrum extorquens]